MKKILVPCDFSITSVNAFRYALEVAQKVNSTIHLLHIIELPVLHDSLLMPTLYFESAYQKEIKVNTLQRFEKLIARYNTNSVNVVGQVEFGVPTKVIHVYTKKQSIDIIIMGSHGASGVKELVIGSNAAKVVRTALVPVLVIKDRVKGLIKKIIFPNALDTPEQADLIMRVKALQSFYKAHVHVVWINTPLNFTPDTITRSKLSNLAKQFDLRNCTLDVFNYSDRESGIIAYSEMMKGNLIAMGTRGRTGLAHTFNRSIAEDVVNHASTPVWTFVTKGE